jgi:hypothetical protein
MSRCWPTLAAARPCGMGARGDEPGNLMRAGWTRTSMKAAIACRSVVAPASRRHARRLVPRRDAGRFR